MVVPEASGLVQVVECFLVDLRYPLLVVLVASALVLLVGSVLLMVSLVVLFSP